MRFNIEDLDAFEDIPGVSASILKLRSFEEANMHKPLEILPVGILGVDFIMADNQKGHFGIEDSKLAKILAVASPMAVSQSSSDLHW